MYDHCMMANSPDLETLEPMTCGTDEEYKEEAESVAKTMSGNNPKASDQEAAKLLEDLLANMPKSGADSSAAALGKISEIM